MLTCGFEKLVTGSGGLDTAGPCRTMQLAHAGRLRWYVHTEIFCAI